MIVWYYYYFSHLKVWFTNRGPQLSHCLLTPLKYKQYIYCPPTGTKTFPRTPTNPLYASAPVYFSPLSRYIEIYVLCIVPSVSILKKVWLYDFSIFLIILPARTRYKWETNEYLNKVVQIWMVQSREKVIEKREWTSFIKRTQHMQVEDNRIHRTSHLWDIRSYHVFIAKQLAKKKNSSFEVKQKTDK